MTVQDKEIAIRVIVVDPPAGVMLAVQLGRSDLHQPTRSSGHAVSFDFTVRVRPVGNTVNVLGGFSQGPPAARFVYVNSGTYAGDQTSSWGRRAKVPLSGISPQLLRELEATPGSVLETHIAGKAKDGGPACATVPLLGDGWAVVV
jgi:hypothetical protein